MSNTFIPLTSSNILMMYVCTALSASISRVAGYGPNV